MGSSAPCDGLTYEGIGHRSCLCSPHWEESFLEHELFTSYNSEEIGKLSYIKDLEIPSFIEDDLNNLMVQELGVSLCETLHIDDTLEPSCDSNATLDPDEIYNQQEVQPLSLDRNVMRGLRKCNPVSCTEEIESSSAAFDAREGFSTIALHDEILYETETPAVVEPLPTALKLASAMKGSRAQQGKCLSKKLGVKWAPEVYDPPPTSSSHTVKGYRHHRPKAKKEHCKQQKLVKSKSSRGSSVERKHTHRKSSSNTRDPRILRLQALGNRSPPARNSLGQSKLVGALDFPVRSQESKCGSSFYTESLAQVHLPVAEAP